MGGEGRASGGPDPPDPVREVRGLGERTEEDLRFSRALIALLKGVLYREDEEGLWRDLEGFRPRLGEVVGLMGLDLWVDEGEGYAFLRSPREDEETLPRLVPRRPLSYPVSLLLALLRRRLAEEDASEGGRLVVTQEELVEMVRVFFRDSSDETKLVDRMGQHLRRIEDLGFLRPLKGQPGTWEVRRILKAFVDPQWLGDLGERMSGAGAEPPEEEP